MLRSNEYGYAVMNTTLDAYSFDHTDLATCKKYCHNGNVIAQRIPTVSGFSILLMWYKWNKLISFKYGMGNLLWLHFSFRKEYLHKTGKIVYRSSVK